jgi:hypothetical protein
MMPLQFVLEEPNKGLLLFWIQDATPSGTGKGWENALTSS